MLRLSILLIILSSCKVLKDNDIIHKGSYINEIFCKYLSNLNFDNSNKIEIYKGFSNDVKDPEKFIRKYGSQSVDFEYFEKKSWLDTKIFCSSFNELIQCNISVGDFDFKNFSNEVKVIRVSEFYFFSNNKGFFIASTVCGESCEVADIYFFEKDENGSMAVKFLSFYYIS